MFVAPNIICVHMLSVDLMNKLKLKFKFKFFNRNRFFHPTCDIEIGQCHDCSRD